MIAMTVKEFVLDGRHMTSVDSFYDEVQRVLCPEFIGFGRNLDAFNDVLRGGLGTFEDGEKIRLRVIHLREMLALLPKDFVRQVLSVIENRDNVEFVEK